MNNHPLDKSLFFDADLFEGRADEWDYPKFFSFDGFSAIYEEERTMWEIASDYHKAGDKLVDMILNNEIQDFIMQKPVLYLYRHAIELYLKYALIAEGKIDTSASEPWGKGRKKHSLVSLMNKLGDVPKDVQLRIMEIHQIDPSSTALRYQESTLKGVGEVLCDVQHLKDVIEAIKIYFGVRLGRVN